MSLMRRKASDPRSVPGTFKQKMKRQVTSVLFVYILFFVALYVPDKALAPLIERLNVGWNFFVKFAGSLAGSIPITFVLQWIIFSQDSLATGSSKESRFFRHCYPSSFARDVYGLKQAEADQNWFDYFNKWQDEKHVDHSYLVDCFKRSYSCRLIYYLVKLSFLFACGAAALMLISFAIDPEDFQKYLFSRMAGLIIVVLSFGWLTLNNRIREDLQAPREDSYKVTGVWFKFKEINGVLIQKFERDVLKPGFPGPALSGNSCRLPP